MSLKGSLQTVALPEVLHFLSSTGKSGEFHVSGVAAEGRLWFEDGRITGFDAGPSEEAFEAIFELLRISDAEFDFAAGIECPMDACHVASDAGDVDAAVEAAQVRLAEWHDIVSVVPSASHVLTLSAEVPNDSVMLEPEQWSMVVAISSGRSVGEVISAMSLREFEGFRAVRTLVERSLVAVGEPVEGAPVVEEAPVVEDVVLAGEVQVEVVDDSAAWDQVDSYPVTTEEPAHFVDDEGAIPGSLLRFGVASPVEDEGEHFAADAADETPIADENVDRYAALHAAIVEIGDDTALFDGEASVEEGSAQVYQFEPDHEVDGRAALQALLTEVTDGEAGVHDGDSVDGLADRGPWTQHELTAMDHQGEWAGDEETSNIVPFAPVHGHAEEESGESEQPEAEEAPPHEEPMNRGLLLKFLSSVRN